MAETTITELDWSSIIAGIRRGNCVPFLGAGVNARADDYEGLPLGGEVARRLLGEIIGDKTSAFDELIQIESQALDDYKHLLRVGAQDLARVSLHIQVKSGNPRLLELLEEMLVNRTLRPSRLLTTLARLPVRLIVTTNYDDLMERAFGSERRPDPLVIVQPVDGFSPKEQRAWTRDLSALGTLDVRPRRDDEPAILYKIHGSFTHGGRQGTPGTDPLIVTEQDYIDFLSIAGSGGKGVPRQISGMLGAVEQRSRIAGVRLLEARVRRGRHLSGADLLVEP